MDNQGDGDGLQMNAIYTWVGSNINGLDGSYEVDVSDFEISRYCLK